MTFDSFDAAFGLANFESKRHRRPRQCYAPAGLRLGGIKWLFVFYYSLRRGGGKEKVMDAFVSFRDLRNRLAVRGD